MSEKFIVQFDFRFFSAGDRTPKAILEDVDIWEDEDNPEGDFAEARLVSSAHPEDLDFMFSKDKIGLNFKFVVEFHSEEGGISGIESELECAGSNMFCEHLGELFAIARKKREHFLSSSKKKTDQWIIKQLSEDVKFLSLLTLWEWSCWESPGTPDSPPEGNSALDFMGVIDSNLLYKALEVP